MSPHLADSIRAAFPHLCTDFGNRETNMDAGFAIRDGWAQLFVQLMCELEALRRALPLEEAALVKLAQVKEKFGGLRVYLENRTDAMWEACRRAEEESFRICEVCGASGAPVGREHRSWMRTLCPACAG